MFIRAEIMTNLRPAEFYTPCPDLWCVTAYYNPAHYRTRRANYETFAAPLRAAGIPLLTVECAFGDDPFDLPPGLEVLQVRGRDVLWQKERLINLGISRLPPQATKVAWLDGDILFTNPDWAVETVALLDHFPIIQPFSERKKLLADGARYDEQSGSLSSFAYLHSSTPSLVFNRGYFEHGSTGFAWAAQRNVLTRHGLYDVFLSGIGDHLMAHAMCGDFTSPCIRPFFDDPLIDKFFHVSSLRQWVRKWLSPALKRQVRGLPGIRNTNRGLQAHFEAWGQGLYQTVQGKMMYVPGTILHLWHGDNADRGYGKRHRELQRLGFNPTTDLRINAFGCWEWASDKPKLHQWAKDFFPARQEDGK
jgi:hypothetical protein